MSASYFDVFRVPMERGRAFSVDEDRPGGPDVAVLSRAFWERAFGGDPAIVGRAVPLGGVPHTVVGVTSVFDMGPRPDVFVPLRADPLSRDVAGYLDGTARLAKGVTLDQARAEMALVTAEFRRQLPDVQPRDFAGFTVERLDRLLVRDSKRTLLLLLAAVGCVLLIACVNVAGLQLARASGRAREIAVRLALGAGRARLVRMMLVESLSLSAAGALIGIPLGLLAVRAILAANLSALPRLADAGSLLWPDTRLLAAMILVTVVTGLLAGVFPARHVWRADPHAWIKEGGARGGPAFARERRLLIAAETALAVVLLVGAGLLVRTMAALASTDPGFETRGILTMPVSLAGRAFERTEPVMRLVDQTLTRIEALPGVSAAAVALTLPLESGVGLPFATERHPPTAGLYTGHAALRSISPHYFSVFRIPIRRGRGFTERDNARSPGVVIVNEAMARRFWGDEDPLGQRIVIGVGMGPLFAEPPREIVGIAADVRDEGLAGVTPRVMYLPHAQNRDALMAFANKQMPLRWVVRSDLAPSVLAVEMERILRIVDGTVAPTGFRTMEEIRRQSTARPRLGLALLGVFAVIAFALAAVGVYAVAAHVVQQRRQEVGIRLALGGAPVAVCRTMAGDGLRAAVAGVVAGELGGWCLGRLMNRLLYGVQPFDPLVFLTVGGALLAVAGLAVSLPAWLAARVSPALTLREG